MGYPIEKIASILDAEPLHGLHPAEDVEYLLIDSRRCLFPGKSLFFAFKGASADGHQFIGDLYQLGVRHFVVSEPPPPNLDLTGANILWVKNTTAALQALARYHRQTFDIPVIGITGSNGKTIVKEWLFQLLQPDFSVVRSPGSYNSKIGVPLSVWQLRPGHEIALFEAGISRPGEMERLADIIRPTVGIFTNLGEAHREGFSSPREKLREKLLLFRSVETLVFCPDDPLVKEEVSRLGIKTFTWSSRSEADLRVLGRQADDSGTLLRLQFHNQTFALHLPFADPASVENALHCIATLCWLGFDNRRIAERAARLEPVALRLEVKEGIRHCTIIDDSYSADLKGLEQALFVLGQQDPEKPRSIILSDFLESGLPAQTLYRQAAELIRPIGIRRFIGVGTEIPAIRAFLPDTVETTFFPDTDALLRVLDGLYFHDEAILLKGARRFAFERVAHRLERRISRTTLEVHLEALIHNLQFFRRLLRPKTRVMAMVKASAYGGGSLEIARKLAWHHVDYLGVAYPDEGVELREGGINLPIMVLAPDPPAFDTLQRFQLEPEIYSLDLLAEYARFAKSRQEPAPLHLNLDTGMRRLGFSESELPELVERLKANPLLRVLSIFSHLPAADDPAEDAFTRAQAESFTRLADRLEKALGYTPMRHLLNSAGLLRFPEYQFDMVRPGLGLYGIAPARDLKVGLKPVFHFKAYLSQVRTVAPGESVGYGRLGRAERTRRIGTITAGYADGFPMGAGQGHFTPFVRGCPAPTVGRICMDLSMIDLTDIPEARPGDPVDLFGDSPAVEDLARAAGTIPYAILTGISPRVKRIYIHEG